MEDEVAYTHFTVPQTKVRKIEDVYEVNKSSL